MRLSIRIKALVILVFVVQGCYKEKDYDVDLSVKVFSGEHLLSSNLTFLDYSYCSNSPGDLHLTVIWDMEEHKTAPPYSMMIPLIKDDFWNGIPHNEDDLHAVLWEYQREVGHSLYSQNKEALCLLAMCEGGIRITSEQSVFGRAPGEDLSDYFQVCFPGVQLKTFGFILSDNENYCSTESYFEAGNFLTPFTLISTRSIAEQTTFYIEIPVRVLMYLSFVRDRLFRPEDAKLESRFSTLSGTIVLSPI